MEALYGALEATCGGARRPASGGRPRVGSWPVWRIFKLPATRKEGAHPITLSAGPAQLECVSLSQ